MDFKYLKKEIFWFWNTQMNEKNTGKRIIKIEGSSVVQQKKYMEKQKQKVLQGKMQQLWQVWQQSVRLLGK